MLFPELPVVLTALFLSLWFWRRHGRDATLWMYGTYAGAAFILWEQLFLSSSFGSGVPVIVRDFLLIGVVGLVQSLAVAKRISIWAALAIILACFIVAYAIPFEENGVSGSTTETTEVTPTIDPKSITDNSRLEGATTTIDINNESPDPAGEYLLERRSDVSEAALLRWAEGQGFGLERAFYPADEAATELDDYYVLDVSVADAATETLIRASNLIDWLEINERVMVSPLEANVSPQPRREYGINDPDAGEQWMMEALGMPEYYQLLRGMQPVKTARIAILDTGVDANHEDLKDNFFSTNKKYDDDPKGHGTHCAGIAAAVTDNGIGVGSPAGPGKFVEVTSIKVLSAGGMGTQKTIIQGMLEAADLGVDVISMSLGGMSSASRQRAYNQAVSYANRNGSIVVAAAGNSNREASGYAPANAAGVICAAAVDNLLLRAPFSNRVGGVQMPLAAPGVAVYSTIPNNRYGAYSGTSMACPFVAGLVGVIKSQRPDWDTKQVYDLLQRTSTKSREVEQVGPIVQPSVMLKALMEER